MAGPANAHTNEYGFRVYEWPGGDTDLHRKYGADKVASVISVTAARSIVGTPFQLVTWQINNLLNLAIGQRRSEWRDYSKSKRGRLVKGYKKDGPFPGEFVTRMLATEGNEEELREVRDWLRSTAEHPRDIAAVRGSVVHRLIEMRVPMKALNEEVIRWYMTQQWDQEKRKVKPDVEDEDVDFVGNAVANFWDMRQSFPFVILAQEPQVWNLTAGYAGSADVLIWFLPEGTTKQQMEYWQSQADKGNVTTATIAMAGGSVALGDWKTSPEVYTGHVVQGTAYLAAEFVGQNGIIDERLTELLKGAMEGAIIKIRPDGWEVDRFRYREDVSHAFFGQIALARFLLMNDKPADLFTDTLSGAAEGDWRSA
jgi:hypothetical protein